jgi:hypothetical protein
MKQGDKVKLINIQPEAARYATIQYYPSIGWTDKIKSINGGCLTLRNWFIGFEKSSEVPQEIIFIDDEFDSI